MYSFIGKAQLIKQFTHVVFVLSLLLTFTQANATTRISDLDANFDPNANAPVQSLAIQADGKILIGGEFTTIAGETRNRLARLNADGTLDEDFVFVDISNSLLSTFNAVLAIAIQNDGKILLAGEFDRVHGQERNHLARLHSDGTLDEDFDPDISGINIFTNVAALVIQTVDETERILIGGFFTGVGSDDRDNFARLNLDGNVDDTFAVVSANNMVLAIALDSNNRIFITGNFSATTENTTENTMENELQRDGSIARLNTDGSLDTSFTPPTLSSFGANPNLFALAVQSDNKLLLGGAFDQIIDLAGVQPNGLIRLNLDGSLDNEFNLPPLQSANAFRVISALAIQSDEKILMGGEFGNIDNTPMTANLARINTDGSLDPSFTPNVVIPTTFDELHAIALQGDDGIIIGGDFNRVGGVDRNYIARLGETVAIVPELNITVPAPDQAISLPEGSNGNNTTFNFTVTRTLNTDGEISVDYTVLGGSANDFISDISTPRTLQFPDGEASQTISVVVNGDNQLENNEEFTVVLSNPVDATLGAVIQASAIIENDDMPEINFTFPAPGQALSLLESTTSSIPFNFTVSRNSSIGTASVDYAVSAGATNPAAEDDFSPLGFAQGTVEFADGEVNQTITVVSIGDIRIEENEEFVVTLSNPVNAILGVANEARAIIENDDQSVININTGAFGQTLTLPEGSGDNTTFNFTITRIPSDNSVASVTYSLFAGSPNGTNSDDFAPDTLTRGTITFADDSSTSQTFSVLVNGDTQAENDETFVITLSNPVNAVLGSGTQVFGIIENDDEGVVIPDDDDLCLPITAQNGNIAVVCL